MEHDAAIETEADCEVPECDIESDNVAATISTPCDSVSAEGSLILFKLYGIFSCVYNNCIHRNNDY